ncbi:hypothetical protein JX266_009335 [Neoarthrinium moseri]|nr:hypothetical protein JX266_009335 [Neoarthrinium moseri]
MLSPVPRVIAENNVATAVTRASTAAAEDLGRPSTGSPRTPGIRNIDGSGEEARPLSSRRSSESGNTQSRNGVGDAPECSVGDLFRSRDAPSFFGSSYFGPQAAAKIIEAPAPEFSSGLPHKSLASSTHSFRDEGGPFSQIWDLLGILPRRKATVDRLTECFLEDLNWAIDAVEAKDFRVKYDTFWSRKFGFDDFATIDLRWLALLFIVLAYGVLLDCPEPKNKDMARELQDTSLRFYWAARRAIVIAPTFYGESVDLVRAGVLVTRYLIYTRRIPESWLTTSFAMRMAQAQGMHIDGERWRLSRQKTETRRRLWSHLYTLDKTIALAIGRPFAIVDQQCLVKLASNVYLDEMDEVEAEDVTEQPLSEPTLSLGNRLAHELAVIIGKIQERCFGLFQVSYDTVLALDSEVITWKERLPPYFRLENPDISKDNTLMWLPWNRLRLHSMFHFARVTLHRPFLLRQSITNRYRISNDVCIASACADLDMRLKYFAQPLADRMKWTLGPHHMFNSALVLGIIVVRDPNSRRSQAILEDLAAYCEMQRNDIWLNEFALAEVKICELCIKKARQTANKGPRQQVPSTNSAPAMMPSPAQSSPTDHLPQPTVTAGPAAMSDQLHDPFFGNPIGGALGSIPLGGPMMWDEQSYAFPETANLSQWEHVLDSIMQDHQILD